MFCWAELGSGFLTFVWIFTQLLTLRALSHPNTTYKYSGDTLGTNPDTLGTGWTREGDSWQTAHPASSLAHIIPAGVTKKKLVKLYDSFLNSSTGFSAHSE